MATVTLVGAGGSEFVFDLPLRHPFDQQVAKGQLQPKGPDDREALASAGNPLPGSEPDLQATAEPSAESSQTAGPPPKVGKGSGRGAWADYAQSIGVEVAEDDKRADIIAKIEAADEGS